MSNTANLSDILSNQTRPAATPPPSSGTAQLDDIVSNHTQAAKAAVTQTPPVKSTGQRIWDAIVHPENSGTSAINLGSQGADSPQTLPATSAPGTVTEGAEKGLTKTLGGVSGLMGGPSATPAETQTKGAAEWTGDALESLAEFYAGDASFRALGVGEKLKALGDIAKVLKDHPVLARLAATGATALRTGGVATAQQIAHGATPADAVKTGAIVGGVGAVAEAAVPPIISGIKKLVGSTDAGATSASLSAGAPTPYQRPNPFRKLLMKPEELGATESAAVTQPAAQSAVRSVVGAAPDAPILNDATTIADQPIKDLYTQAKQEYKKVDDLVGFDLKAEKLALSNDQYNLKQLGNTDADNAARIKLNTSIQDSTKRIADAEAQLKTAGLDPKQADNLFRAGRAGEQFKTLLVRATNPDGTVKVDSLLNGSKVLRFNPKYGDRLAQFFGQGDAVAGKAAADSFMSDLQAAKKAGDAAGQKAIAGRTLRNMILKYVVPSAGAGLAAAAGYELAK